MHAVVTLITLRIVVVAQMDLHEQQGIQISTFLTCSRQNRGNPSHGVTLTLLSPWIVSSPSAFLTMLVGNFALGICYMRLELWWSISSPCWKESQESRGMPEKEQGIGKKAQVHLTH